MHYYTFNIGDYRRQTHHLTLVEHGIYRSLLDTYYLKEEPLCANHAQLMRSHSIRTEEEKTAFNNVISDFFTLHDEGYRHHVCDKIIAKYQEKSEKARKSAQARWGNDASASRTQCEGNANHKPRTKNHKPRTKGNNITSEKFDEFWSVYPKKADKKKTKEIWKRRKLDNLANTIIPDIENRLLNDKKWKEGFIPNPTTYLNGDRWEDEIEVSKETMSLADRMEAYEGKSPFDILKDDEGVISEQ